MMKVSIRFVGTLIIAFGLFHSVMGQDRPNANQPQGENLEVPEGWNVRLDRPSDEVVIGSDPDSADIYFVNMTPGWHITTGPAGIFYHPANTAAGDFTIKADLHLFDPGERNREAFGLFWGGRDLDSADQFYYYFLIRNTGDFLIKKRVGDTTEMIKEWTPSEAVVVYDDPETSSVMNALEVSVQEGRVSFRINGEEVSSISAEGMQNDGIFGLRVNHSINLHISDLAILSK
ncbi:hypothetical protein [Gracilimonas tropica]|uniref:hypothetical protein n=1 Tax=Gracilimonas tropica TaxID=454600 RepID=UPI0012FAA5AD|nr:hypothetical protein [Gracilimonas tropica]